MKKTTSITREEETYTCDFCSKVLTFPTKTCAGCGKHTCNEACNYLQMVDYRGGPPFELSSMEYSFGTGIRIPSISFCLACDKTDKLAVKFREIKQISADIEKAYSEYRRSHSKLAATAVRMFENRPKES